MKRSVRNLFDIALAFLFAIAIAACATSQPLPTGSPSPTRIPSATPTHLATTPPPQLALLDVYLNSDLDTILDVCYQSGEDEVVSLAIYPDATQNVFLSKGERICASNGVTGETTTQRAAVVIIFAEDLGADISFSEKRDFDFTMYASGIPVKEGTYVNSSYLTLLTLTPEEFMQYLRNILRRNGIERDI